MMTFGGSGGCRSAFATEKIACFCHLFDARQRAGVLPVVSHLHTRAKRSTFPRFCPMFALRRAAARAVAARGSFNSQRVALRAFAAQCPHDPSKPYHKSPLPLDAAGGLLEYSVVYTDRAMNHMSKPFCKVRRDARAAARRAASVRSARHRLSPTRVSRGRPKRTHEKYRSWNTGCVFATGGSGAGGRRAARRRRRDVLRPSRGIWHLARKRADAPPALPRRSCPPHARVPDGSSPSAKTDATERVLSPLRAFRPRNRPRPDASSGV